MAKSKSKSKSKSTKKNQMPKKSAPKSKKKSVKSVPKATPEKKSTKNQKTKGDKKSAGTNKGSKQPKRESTAKKTNKSKSKETKRKNDKAKPTKPVESDTAETTDSLKPDDTVKQQDNGLDDLPIIMECTESDDDDIRNSQTQEHCLQPEIDDIDTMNPQLDFPDDLHDPCINGLIDNGFDQTAGEFNIDIDLSSELIDEELSLNFDCLADLPQLGLGNEHVGDFRTNNFQQMVLGNDSGHDFAYSGEFAGINTGFDLSSRIDGNVNTTVSSTGNEIQENLVKILQNEEVINCTCGFREEDGLMVQCDICLTWQHALCGGMNSDSEVPENYLCAYCTQPTNVRPTQRYSYAKHFLTLSKLPRFSRRTCEEELFRRREAVMTRTFELTADLRRIHKMERTVTAKLSIAEEPDHPKLYMWSANWDSQDPVADLDSAQLAVVGPVGERPIESVDCRLRLLDKIDADQRDMASRLSTIYDRLKQLESDDLQRKNEEKDLKRVLRMFEKDLKTVATAATVS